MEAGRHKRQADAFWRGRHVLPCVRYWHAWAARKHLLRQIMAVAVQRLKDRVTVATLHAWLAQVYRCKAMRSKMQQADAKLTQVLGAGMPKPQQCKFRCVTAWKASTPHLTAWKCASLCTPALRTNTAQARSTSVLQSWQAFTCSLIACWIGHTEEQ